MFQMFQIPGCHIRIFGQDPLALLFNAIGMVSVVFVRLGLFGQEKKRH